MKRSALTASVASAVVLVSLVSGCGSDGPQAAPASPVTLSLVSELSGSNSLIGRATQSGVQTAVQVINDAGGIKGHRVVVKTFDSQSSPTVGPSVFREAYAAKPAAVVGFTGSATVAGAVPLIAASRVPFITAGTVFPGVETLPFFFSTGPGNAAGANGVVEALRGKLGGTLKGKRIFIQVASPSPAFDAKLNLLRARIKKAGGLVSSVDRTALALSSYTSQAANVAATKPDAAVLMHGEAATATIAKALNVAGLSDIPIVADVLSSSDALLQQVSAPNFYVLRDAVPIEPGSAIYKEVVKAKASTSRAQSSPFFGRGYAAVMLAAKALERCGVPCSTDKFVSSVKALGAIGFSPNPLNGPLDFRSDQAGNTHFQIWSWDTASKKSVVTGKVFSAKE